MKKVNSRDVQGLSDANTQGQPKTTGNLTKKKIPSVLSTLDRAVLGVPGGFPQCRERPGLDLESVSHVSVTQCPSAG